MINIKNLSKQFGSFRALNDLNIDMKKGECFGLLGRNGAGKSTTIKIMVGLMQSTYGKVTFDNKNIYDYPEEVKSKISYIPDTPYVYEKLTGVDFMFFVGYTFGMEKDKIKQKTEKFFDIFDIKEVANKKIESYSHGMRQKLVLSAALLHNPEYIIIDEPMVGLDVQAARIIKNIIKYITKNHNVGVVLTTHQIHVAGEICDRIGIIHEGKLHKLMEANFDVNNIEDNFLEVTGGEKTDKFNFVRS